jgi:hypothetical protein
VLNQSTVAIYKKLVLSDALTHKNIQTIESFSELMKQLTTPKPLKPSDGGVVFYELTLS